MQRLNVTRVNAAARKAYKVRKLSAQHPKRAMRKCNYQVGDEIVRLGRNDNTSIGKLWLIARMGPARSAGPRRVLA